LFKTGHVDWPPDHMGVLTDIELVRPLKVGTKVYEVGPLFTEPDPSLEMRGHLTPRVALPYEETATGRADWSSLLCDPS
jgi:hypothetical protein